MENKKYLDKVLDHMVRGVKINYDTGRVYTPFLHPLLPLTFSFFLSNSIPSTPTLLPFFKYCVYHFGLTDDEIEYVWDKYKDIITDKIKNGE